MFREEFQLSEAAGKGVLDTVANATYLFGLASKKFTLVAQLRGKNASNIGPISNKVLTCSCSCHFGVFLLSPNIIFFLDVLSLSQQECT